MDLKYTFQPEGPTDARIAVVCEKPANEEIRFKRLLSGPSGQRVRAHMAQAGFDAGSSGSLLEGARPSREVWLTNAVQSFDSLGNPSIADIVREQPRLIVELASLPRLNCIIAMGNAALAALTNFHCAKPNKKGELTGITAWRGSVIQTVAGTKLVPTFHPAFYQRGEWRFAPIVSFDVQRAARQAGLAGPPQWPRRTFYVEPTSVREVYEWLDMLEHDRNAPLFETGPGLSYDIETIKGAYNLPYISCIALSSHPSVAYCIPFLRRGSRYWMPDDEAAIWYRLAQLFQSTERCFVSQNGTAFDNWVLRRHGISIPNWHRGFDTMLAHRRLSPDLPHSLDFLTSIYTSEPYYKDESGRGEEFGRVPLRQFWIYNCKDAAVTLECAVGLRADLKEVGQLKQFIDEDMTRCRVAAAKIEKGFRVDKEELDNVKRKLQAEIAERESDLGSKLGFVPKVKSYLDMGAILDKYGVRYSRTAKGRPAISEEQLLLYAHRNPNVKDIVATCLYVRERETLQSNFLQIRLDPQGFYHAIIDPCKTKSGRDASQSAHEGGPQILNIPESLRHMFVPDRPDLVLTTADLKQAEAMYVAWDSQCPFLMAAFESGKDVHRIRGCSIFHNWRVDYHRSPDQILPPDDLIALVAEVCQACSARGETKCTHSERFIAKVSGHAFAYKMGPRKFVTKVLPPAGIFISEAEGKRIRDCVVTPAVAQWQANVSLRLKKSRWLENPLGRKREFFGLHDEDMDRDALAWLASSTITDIIAPAERALHEEFERFPLEWPSCRVVQQWYDSVTICHPPELTRRIHALMQRQMEKPIYLHGRKLVIPAEFKTGTNWAFKGDKKPPTGPSPNTLLASAGD